MDISREEKIKFIENAFREAKVVNTLQEQIDKVIDNFYNSIAKDGIIHRDDYIAFFNKILDTENGYTEEDKAEYEANPDAMRGKLNSYQAYLTYEKIIENETEEDEEGNIVFKNRKFDIDEYREFFRKDFEQAKQQLVMD